MSLTGAINSAVSGLNAQSAALAIVANNLANTSTTGYKTTTTSFSSMLAGSTGVDSTVASGGVVASGVSNISAQGQLTDSEVSTNMAISGSGFFAVAASTEDSSVYYTRNGEFSVDSEGYLVNNGYYLMGWETDADGNVIGNATNGNLVAIDTDAIASIAEATSTMSMVANLPANAVDGDTFTSSVEVYDSLGTAATVSITWEKTGENEWTATFSNPTSADGTTEIGEVTSDPITISFNGDGTLAGTDPSPPTLSIENWTTGASDSAIALDMGDAGAATGLSQYSSGSDELSVSLTTDQDGNALGSLSGISIAEDGTVSGVYDNGMTRALYKVPLTTFTNADGLSALSGGIYQATTESGSGTLKTAGSDGAGTIYGSQLELSTADTNTEFAKMMAAQQAYSGAAQVVSAVNSMFDTLMSAIR
jgi:flagellar hook protein FlgE